MNSVRGMSMSAAAVLLCAAAGCAHSKPVPAAAAAATPTASAATMVTAGTPQELASALQKSAPRKNFAFSVKLPDVTAKGLVASDAADITVVAAYDDETDTAEEVAIGTDRYLRLSVKSKDFDKAKKSSNPSIRQAAERLDGRTWFKIDPKRLKSAVLELDLNDVTSLGPLLKRTTPDLGNVRGMTGTVNLASIHGPHRLIDFDAVKSAGSAALKSSDYDTVGGALQPFEATLDPQGRLLDLKASTNPPAWDFTFTGYDAQQAPAAPRGAAALPAAMYDWIND
ncbi:hypothetical protein ACIA5C_16920 [Actinoplanes sp. NPDC051343]|uniref:hypothetical protein n=1 Tax=Actinoplanes sp. NPDC051343 TaxID=3363906 RepID=UPI0037AE838F